MAVERSLKDAPIAPTDTKTRILEVAFRLFHEQGYHATGIATILREAEANAGSLYHYFPSKEALLVGVLEYAAQIMHGVVMAPAEAATADPIERIFALLDNYRRGMEMFHCKMGCPIGNLALEVGDDNPPARALIDLNFRNWAAVITGWLEGAGDRLPVDMDRRSLAHFVLTVMEGGIMQARAAGNLTPFDESVAQLRAYIDLLLERARSRKGAA
jgi:TetR/AcrR family transcriptional regulator, transcriptional repressor for nem operon